MNTGNILLSQQIGDILQSGNPAPLQIRFRFTNLGRTAAFVKEISAKADWGISTEEMTYGGYKDADGLDWLCMPQETRGPKDIRTRKMAPADAKGIMAGDFHILIWGRVVYDDVIGDEHITAFCRRYDPKTDDLEAAGTPEQNKRT